MAKEKPSRSGKEKKPVPVKEFITQEMVDNIDVTKGRRPSTEPVKLGTQTHYPSGGEQTRIEYHGSDE